MNTISAIETRYKGYRSHQWGVSIALTCVNNRAAAEAVRAHRFDGR